jgi:hypothetical protein
MSDDVKGEDVVEQLREAFAANIRTAIAGLPAHQALQLADTLCAVQLDALASLRVSYRARPAVDGAAITEDWRRGLTVQEITKKHGVSRPTAYKHHPTKGQRRTG